MPEFSFIIHGEPVPQLRARIVPNRNGKGFHGFNPDKCIVHAERIRLAALRESQKSSFVRLEGPLELRIDFYRSKPKSRRKDSWPITKPDLSNYAKLVEDSLNGLVWEDDSQIVSCVLRKLYAEDMGRERTEVWVRELVPSQIQESSDREYVLSLEIAHASSRDTG